jgi:hypothetical protein
MIGDKQYTEAAETHLVRQMGLVGERNRCSEAEPEGEVERRLVRMQTRVAINQMRILVAVNPRFPGPGSSPQG